MYDFDLMPARAGSDSVKWAGLGEDVIPMWVADMDFKSPQPVLDAIMERAAHPYWGYPIGLDQLTDLVDTLFENKVPCDGSVLSNPRQFDAIRRAYEAMLSALQGLKLGLTPDAVLTDVETAMEAMGEVTGATVREDITARIFERFCVGK